VVCLATSADELATWNKHPANPVIGGPPAELGTQTGGQFRDPFVWKENGQWQMVMGSKVEGQGGLVLRYRSDDLVHWEYLGVLLKGDISQTKPFWTGTVWECPNFFKLGDQHVLIVSVQAEPHTLLYPVYYAGGFDGQHFAPAVQRILVHGSCFYAPQIMRREDGRIVMWGWLKEGRRQTALLEAGWAGVMSLPIEVSWLPEGALRLAPVDELKSLRREHWHFENLAVTAGDANQLGDVQGDCLEIEAVFEAEPSSEFGLRLRCSPDGQEQTRVVYAGGQERLVVEPNQASLSTVVDRDMHKAPLSLGADDRLRLRLFLDRSVLEVFANEHTCLASRIYPTRPDSLGLGLFVRAGKVTVKSLDIWTIASTWD
jgi:beta-fructofuranosidase